MSNSNEPQHEQEPTREVRIVGGMSAGGEMHFAGLFTLSPEAKIVIRIATESVEHPFTVTLPDVPPLTVDELENYALAVCDAGRFADTLAASREAAAQVGLPLTPALVSLAIDAVLGQSSDMLNYRSDCDGEARRILGGLAEEVERELARGDSQ